jgi:sigma-B regulation protein RsbU (phosphoserine phosphatase)
MQNTDTVSGEDELIRLLLKRQSELNSLLEVTRAINKNSPTPVLVQMLEVILKSYLQIGMFRFLVEDEENFICISKYGGAIEPVSVLHRLCASMNRIRVPTAVNNNPDPTLKLYDYFIPIYQKSKPIAYALIGNFNSSPEMLSNDLNFIQTLINVVVVALENKKLFSQRIQSERFRREMELAVEVQNMLVPLRTYKDKAVHLDARYLPHQNIGGDYVDFIRLNDDEFLWCIADVSGKGISAALLMANFQASLHAWATVEDDLVNIMERLNKIVLNNTKGERFITVFLAKYNQKTRLLNYINAGHNPTMICSKGEVVHLKLGTTMIGVFDDLPFINQGEVDIEPGTMIFNYTDGVTDYDSQGPKLWNEEKLYEFVMQNGDLTPEKFNQLLLDHLNNVTKGKAIDDITLLTMRIA